MGEDPERIWERLLKLLEKLLEKVWKGNDVTGISGRLKCQDKSSLKIRRGTDASGETASAVEGSSLHGDHSRHLL